MYSPIDWQKDYKPLQKAREMYCFEYFFMCLLDFLFCFSSQQLFWLPARFQTQMFTTKNKCSLSLHIPHDRISIF